MKFSDNYVDYKYNQDNNFTDFTIKKDLMDKDNKFYYKWGCIGYTILVNNECFSNKKLLEIKDDCFNIEKLIKNNNLEPATHYIVNYLLPHLDQLNKNDISLLYRYYKINDGPLYKKLETIRTPNIFIDLFSLI